jgi:hypothetical protein
MARVDIALEADSLDIASPTRLVTGLDLVAQRIRVGLALHRGDVLRDASIGLPWVEWFGQKPVPVATIVARVRRVIEAVPGVLRADVSAQMNTSTGELALEAEVVAEEGRFSVRQVVADGGTKNMSFRATFVVR